MLFAAGVDGDEPLRVAGSAIGDGGQSGRGDAGVSAGVHARLHGVLRTQASATRAVATATLTSLLRWVRRDLPGGRRYVRLVKPVPLLVREGSPPASPHPTPAQAAFPPAAAGKRTAPAAGTPVGAAGSSLSSTHSHHLQPATRGCGPSIPSCAAATSHDTEIEPQNLSTVLLLDGDICTRREGVSFHLPLHRFFAALLRESAATPQPAPPLTAAADSPAVHSTDADPVFNLGSLLDDVVREVSSWPPPADDLHCADAIPQREGSYRSYLKTQASCTSMAAGPVAPALSWPHDDSPLAWSPGASGGEGTQPGHGCGEPPHDAAGRPALWEPGLPLHSNESADGSGDCDEDQTDGSSSDESIDNGGSLAAEAGDEVDRRPRRARQRLAVPPQDAATAAVTARVRAELERGRALREAPVGRPPPTELEAGGVLGPGSSRMPPRAAQPLMRRGSGASSACTAGASSSSSTSKEKRTAPEGAPPPWPPRLGGAETKRLLLLQLVEHPLRVLALSAQAGAYLWRRNGAEILSQVSLAWPTEDGFQAGSSRAGAAGARVGTRTWAGGWGRGRAWRGGAILRLCFAYSDIRVE